MKYKAKTSYQKDHTVEEYDKKRFKNIKGRLTNRLEIKLIERALKRIGINPPASIIDVPCGTGRVTLHLLKKGFSVTGTDISSAMVEHTNKSIEKEFGENINKAKVEDAENLSFADNYFDAGVSLRLLGHVPPENRLKILRSLGRVCKKGLVLAYYNRYSLKNIMRRKKRKRKKIPWYPAGRKEIKAELEKSGLKVDRVFYLLRFFSETMLIVVKLN